jgi:hypothetical protein
VRLVLKLASVAVWICPVPSVKVVAGPAEVPSSLVNEILTEQDAFVPFADVAAVFVTLMLALSVGASPTGGNAYVRVKETGVGMDGGVVVVDCANAEKVSPAATAPMVQTLRIDMG